jgi:hypothetical protein
MGKREPFIEPKHRDGRATERKGEISPGPEQSNEQHESSEGGQQREAQAGRQLGAVEQALECSREQREQREVQGGSRDAVEQALARSHEQREAQGDARDATAQALVRSREAGSQAEPAGLEVADNERPGESGPLGGQEVGQAKAEPMENPAGAR